jgi:hypothetical protein
MRDAGEARSGTLSIFKTYAPDFKASQRIGTARRSARLNKDLPERPLSLLFDMILLGTVR